ncbi:DUF4239 domain-containing protein [Pseudonocardiaceae bacterium YIM PH 21723]|nr:DUF4239 domain-containing protein [Pseudonocardiaceae bacterium YIM PH 21723]
MNIYVSGALWMLGAAVVTGVVAVLARRYQEAEGRVSNNEAAGHVFTIVGGLQAVLLAFVLISLFDGVSSAETGAKTEANALVAVSWAADSLPEPARSQIHKVAKDYGDTVRDVEWPQMHADQQVSSDGDKQLDALHKSIAAVTPENDAQKQRLDDANTSLKALYEARQDRLDAANGNGVSTVVWIALIVGAVLSVTFPYVFGGTKTRTHVFIVASLAATITLMLFAIYQLQDPYTGGAEVGPDAFDAAIDRLTR